MVGCDNTAVEDKGHQCIMTTFMELDSILQYCQARQSVWLHMGCEAHNCTTTQRSNLIAWQGAILLCKLQEMH